MSGYMFTCRCPGCGGGLAHVNGAALGSESVAVARCGPCAREWMVRVYLAPVETPEQRRARERKASQRARLEVVGA